MGAEQITKGLSLWLDEKRGSCVDDLQDARVKRRWRSVECSHVFGLWMQLCALLALMKSAAGLPNHVNALEAL